MTAQPLGPKPCYVYEQRFDADLRRYLLSYTLRAEKVPAFYVKFRSTDLEKFTHGYLRNVARDMFNETAGKYSIEQIMGDNGPFLAEVRQKYKRKWNPLAS